MSQKQESYFWTSYSDLMTTLFFVMLLLFVLASAMLKKDKDKIKAEKDEIENIVKSTEDLSKKYFRYESDYKKFVLNIDVKYHTGKSDMNDMIADDKEHLLRQLRAAGVEIQNFLERHKENQYALIIEGQASRDSFNLNYELSYQRALGLTKFWIKDSNLNFGENCEILISGSGDGKLDTHSMRDTTNEANQRFLIHILPKNILENSKKNISTIK